jgi:hypothetical protein
MGLLGKGGTQMLDVNTPRELTDSVLDEEIDLLGHLVLAASGRTRHFTPDEVDRLLDVHRPDSREQLGKRQRT